jgi:hypothetical protein
MSDGQIQTAEQPTVAFILSLLAVLGMLGAGSMRGGFGLGGMMGGWHAMGGDVGAGHGQFWSAVALV